MTISIVIKTRNLLDRFAAKAVVAGCGADLLDDLAECIVALAGDDRAAGVDPGGDVAVSVIGGEVRDWGSDAGEGFHHNQTADSSCTLERLGKIESPGLAGDPVAAIVLQLDVPTVREEVGGVGEAGDGFDTFGAAT